VIQNPWRIYEAFLQPGFSIYAFRKIMSEALVSLTFRFHVALGQAYLKLNFWEYWMPMESKVLRAVAFACYSAMVDFPDAVEYLATRGHLEATSWNCNTELGVKVTFIWVLIVEDIGPQARMQKELARGIMIGGFHRKLEIHSWGMSSGGKKFKNGLFQGHLQHTKVWSSW